MLCNHQNEKCQVHRVQAFQVFTVFSMLIHRVQAFQVFGIRLTLGPVYETHVNLCLTRVAK